MSWPGRDARVFKSYTQGLLVHGLAAVQPLGQCGGLLRIFFGLGQGEPTRIFGFGVMQRVECGGYPPSRIQIPCHTGVEQCFLCLALLPVAIKGQPGKRCYAAGITINAISLYRGLAIVVTAAIEPQPVSYTHLTLPTSDLV